MSERCKKCFMMKFTPNQKCACGTVKTEKKPKPIKTNVLPKKVSDKKRKRLKENGTEGDLFKKLLKKRIKTNDNFCQVCQKKIVEEAEYSNEVSATSACFPHILGKGQFPAYRYFENNIGMVCGIDHHQTFDKAVNMYREEKGLVELEQRIKDGKVINLKKYLKKLEKTLK